MSLVKWLKWIFIILLIIIIITPFLIYGYMKYNHHITEKKTYQYLIEYGYEDTEILNIESRLMKGTLFTAEVTFKDKPDIIHYYKIRNDKLINMGSVKQPKTEDPSFP